MFNTNVKNIIPKEPVIEMFIQAIPKLLPIKNHNIKSNIINIHIFSPVVNIIIMFYKANITKIQRTKKCFMLKNVKKIKNPRLEEEGFDLIQYD